MNDMNKTLGELQVQLGTGQSSPTLSPNSPAAASNSRIPWFTHTRSPSVSSVISYRPARTSESGSSFSVHL